MASIRNSNVQLLATLVDSSDEDESEYRFLVDRKHVKYVTVDPGVLPKEDRTSAPILLAALPPFPSGEWNEGYISEDPVSRQPTFSLLTKSSLPGISNTWHPTKIDHLEFKKLDRIRQNIHKVTHPLFDRTVLIKFAEFPWQIPFFEAETTAYEWIDGWGVGPKFLGHLTEEGRVIGFVMEYIDSARLASAEDLATCQDTLVKLHALGIRHGDVNKYNFLVLGEKAVLVDFETAQRCSQQEDLEAEHECLKDSLSDSLRRGGME